MSVRSRRTSFPIVVEPARRTFPRASPAVSPLPFAFHSAFPVAAASAPAEHRRHTPHRTAVVPVIPSFRPAHNGLFTPFTRFARARPASQQHPAVSAPPISVRQRQDHVRHQSRRFCACPEIHQRYSSDMSTVFDIENAVQKLSRNDLTTFRDWFLSFDAAAWDKQFEADVAAGHLDALADEAIRDLREGRCTDL